MSVSRGGNEERSFNPDERIEVEEMTQIFREDLRVTI